MAQRKSVAEVLKALPRGFSGGPILWEETLQPDAKKWFLEFVDEVRKFPRGDRPSYPDMLEAIEQNIGKRPSERKLRNMLYAK